MILDRLVSYLPLLSRGSFSDAIAQPLQVVPAYEATRPSSLWIGIIITSLGVVQLCKLPYLVSARVDQYLRGIAMNACNTL